MKKDKQISDAADRFALIDLKIEVEASVVESLVIDVKNFAD